MASRGCGTIFAMTGLRFTLLGSGSPTPNLARCHPALLVEWGDRGRMLVDAGDGVVAQLLRAGVELQDVEHVALTHMHWDHILGYPAFIWGSWTAGRRRLTTFGPAGTEAMHRQLVADYYDAQAAWAIDLGYPASGWRDVDIHEVKPGWSTVVDGCIVRAGRVVHPPMSAVAYRFEYSGRSLVVSGDTAACAELVEFSRRADALVVDACAAPPPVSASPQRRDLIERLRGFHATPDECVAMAGEAEVGHVVLTHHLPDVVPQFDRGTYAGDVTIGEDLASFVV